MENIQQTLNREISYIYEEIYSKHSNLVKNAHITQAVERVAAALPLQQSTQLERLARDPALQATWQSFKELADQLPSDIKSKEKLQKIAKQIIDISSKQTKPSIKDLCKKHHVNYAEYQSFVQNDNPNQMGVDGETPMTRAVIQNKENMVALLKELGADINKPNHDGLTPIILAILNPHCDRMVQLLHHFGADINKPIGQGSLKGHTPLVVATQVQGNIVLRDHIKKLLISLGADHKYVTEFLERKALANIWGLKGTSSLTDRSGNTVVFPVEGLGQIELLPKYIKDFFASDDLVNRYITKKDQKEIEEAFAANALPQSTDDILAKIRTNKPVVISGGTKNHAISIAIHKNLLIVGNRGFGRTRSAVKSYLLPPEMINKGLIEKLRKWHSDIQSFNQVISQLKFVDGYYQKNQESGNCVLASPKAVFGVLCRLCAKENMGKDIYKAFTTFMRRQRLVEYLKHSKQPDAAMLQQIKKKYHEKAKKSERFRNFWMFIPHHSDADREMLTAFLR